jgi:hypothetical protein
MAEKPMKPGFRDLIREVSKLDITRICQTWSWLMVGQEDLAFVSLAGDLFFTGINGEINWLETGSGQLRRVADNIEHFEQLCEDEDNLDYWFLSTLIGKLIDAGKILGENEVYGYSLMPMLGGEYSLDNCYPVDLYRHFELTGIICESTKDVADGTAIGQMAANTEIREDDQTNASWNENADFNE